MLGINAVAAPIFDSNDACVGALAMVGSIQFLPEKARPGDIAALVHAAEQISRKLGHGSNAPFATPRHRGMGR
jgi:DNA-binding IclR family transcriptional regulator